MTISRELSACVRCRELAEVWWEKGLADQKGETGATERAFALHLRTDHAEVTAGPVEGCSGCRTVLAVLNAPFSPPGESLTWQDGTVLHPSDLHFARHVLERTAELAQ